MDDLIFERFLAGDCSAGERALVEAWLREHPGERALQYLAEFRRTPVDWRTSAEWQRLAARLAAGRPLLRRSWWTRVATAAAVLISVSAAGVYFLRRGRVDAPVVTSFATARGERREVVLQNGAVAMLGPASMLRFTDSKGHSDVDLSGVARFHVVHDAAHVFVVHARGVETTDIGTEFVVRAYPGDAERGVAVTEGLVAVHVAESTTPPVELHAGDIGIIDPSGAIDVRRGADLARFTDWARGRLVFDDRSLQDVATELMRWFDVDLRIADQRLAGRHVTAAYNTASLGSILAALSEGLGLRVSTAGRVITLSSAGRQ